MKKLLALALVLMVAGGAMAQTPYNYEGCAYRLGVFFSASNSTFEVNNASTNFDYTPFTPFFMHLVMIDCPEQLSAYEMQISGVPAAGFLATWEMVPGSGWINIGTATNHIAAFGFPQPNPAGVTRLGAWNLININGQTVPFNLAIGPSVPSSIANDGPAIVVAGELWRTNFTPGTHSGCQVDLAPGDFPELVGSVFGDGIELEVIIATQAKSLTGVKALFN